MPIVKKTATELHAAGRDYFVCDCLTLRAVTACGADAIAIWVYLCDRPANWVVRESEVKATLKIGRDRYRNAMRALREIGVACDTRTRNNEGKYKSHAIAIHNYPPDIQEPVHVDESTSTDNPPYGQLHGGKSTPLKNTKSLNKTKTHTRPCVSDNDKQKLDQDVQRLCDYKSEWSKTGGRSSCSDKRIRQLWQQVSTAHTDLTIEMLIAQLRTYSAANPRHNELIVTAIVDAAREAQRSIQEPIGPTSGRELCSRCKRAADSFADSRDGRICFNCLND